MKHGARIRLHYWWWGKTISTWGHLKFVPRISISTPLIYGLKQRKNLFHIDTNSSVLGMSHAYLDDRWGDSREAISHSHQRWSRNKHTHSSLCGSIGLWSTPGADGESCRSHTTTVDWHTSPITLSQIPSSYERFLAKYSTFAFDLKFVQLEERSFSFPSALPFPARHLLLKGSLSDISWGKFFAANGLHLWRCLQSKSHEHIWNNWRKYKSAPEDMRFSTTFNWPIDCVNHQQITKHKQQHPQIINSLIARTDLL